jgi:uncharacterized protein YxeA
VRISLFVLLGVIVIGIGVFIFYKIRWGAQDRAVTRNRKEENEKSKNDTQSKP